MHGLSDVLREVRLESFRAGLGDKTQLLKGMDAARGDVDEVDTVFGHENSELGRVFNGPRRLVGKSVLKQIATGDTEDLSVNRTRINVEIKPHRINKGMS